MTGSELYQIARKYLGKGGATFRKFCGLSAGAPYCCAYVCYIFFTNGLNKLFYGGKKVTYCPNAIKWCKANLAQLPIYLAMPMDIAFFDWNHNGVPDHIGFVKSKKSSDSILTHEGNTSGGIVAEKERTVGYMMGGVFRPLYAPKGLKKEVLKPDGDFGYRSVYMFQVMLGLKPDGILGRQTLKTWQTKLGQTPDASWGKKTTLAAQRLVGVRADGAWGPASTRALQEYINKKCFPNTSTKTSTSPVKTSTPAPKTSTPTRKKMSKIGHAMCDCDHKAGDSSGKEVKKSSFTYKTSSTSVYNWTYVFRPKDVAKANKAADMCEKAIANNNIGYCASGETKYGKKKAMTKLAKAAGYDLSKINVKCGLSCGDLICLCNRYAGLSTCYIGSGKPLAAKLKKNNNFECKPYKKGMQLYRGDVLITAHSNGKNNHVVMCL